MLHFKTKEALVGRSTSRPQTYWSRFCQLMWVHVVHVGTVEAFDVLSIYEKQRLLSRINRPVARSEAFLFVYMGFISGI